MKRLAVLAGSHWRGFVLAALAMAVFAATEIGFAFAVERLTALLGDASSPWGRWLPAGVLGLFLVRGMAGFVSAWQLGRIGRSVVGRMREMLFERFLRMPVRSIEQRPRAELLSRMLYDAEQVADAASTVITTVVRDSLTVLGLMAYMVYASAGLSAVVFVAAPLIALTARVLSKHFRRYSARLQENMGEVSRITDEALRGHRIIKVFGGSLRERERFSSANENNKRLHLKLVMARAGGDGLTMLLAAVGVASVAWFVARYSAADGLEIEKFTGFMAAMLLLMTPLKHLTNVNAALQRGLAAAASVFGLLDSPAESDRARADKRSLPARATGRLEFVNVAFSYESGEAAALRDINLEIEPGQRVAIVGRSGSGKSTLVSLIPRFFEPDSGKLLLDGRPLAEWPLTALREQIALVTQDVMLFNDTLANNIAYGALAGAEPQAVEAAARAAHVTEFAATRREGLDALVGEGGLSLSGGERQRVAIARALLKDAPVLILDEATSALDSRSESHVQEALDRLMRGRTTLVIAHRLSTIEHADRIVVLERGRIVESGPHARLLARGGHYASLYRLQFRGHSSHGACGP
ncbi:MAG: lipid A export permease/ATP-binding protein MsbA [Gammaproteobacteria bacterium]|nr:lipid A export permease/ATP-binding protein MsbA [Gammaproteobacteria bacterium]